MTKELEEVQDKYLSDVVPLLEKELLNLALEQSLDPLDIRHKMREHVKGVKARADAFTKPKMGTEPNFAIKRAAEIRRTLDKELLSLEFEKRSTPGADALSDAATLARGLTGFDPNKPKRRRDLSKPPKTGAFANVGTPNHEHMAHEGTHARDMEHEYKGKKVSHDQLWSAHLRDTATPLAKELDLEKELLSVELEKKWQSTYYCTKCKERHYRNSDIGRGHIQQAAGIAAGTMGGEQQRPLRMTAKKVDGDLHAKVQEQTSRGEGAAAVQTAIARVGGTVLGGHEGYSLDGDPVRHIQVRKPDGGAVEVLYNRRTGEVDYEDAHDVIGQALKYLGKALELEKELLERELNGG